MENRYQSALKRGRGRPEQHGVQPGWMLLRFVEVIRLFDRFRDDKSKFETAVNETVQEFKRLYPDMKINATEVRRIHRAMADTTCGLEWSIRETVQPDGAILRALQSRERRPKLRRNSKAILVKS